ncbi:putative rhomboid family membrane protein [Phaeomoniella chlamydospora]|uniref:Rhomboid-type serine protease n=1 Tax=Phaeomoniella chlamydospora TaxID=158046 RepID=A0A0G2EP44_PHACM|nr:putative rhomboid family membrane protein [Phaeomoniella chlamydospora]
MFLHAGIIHIGVNMLMQMTMGREMEKQIGSLRFASVYISSGIFGFVLGANFAGEGTASTGASGALFGIMGLYLLDLFYNWRERRKPVRDLMFSLLDIVIAFVLGLIPGVVDNFSHMGGLLMGLVLGICLLHSPNALRERLGTSTSYHPMNPTNPASPTQESPEEGFTAFKKKPVGFFKGRKPLWWAWWLLRAGAVVGVFVCFIVLLNNFYKYRNTCSWCKYLSCLPIKDWCESGDLQLSNSTSKRDLFGVSGQRFYVFYE